MCRSLVRTFAWKNKKRSFCKYDRITIVIINNNILIVNNIMFYVWPCGIHKNWPGEDRWFVLPAKEIGVTLSFNKKIPIWFIGRRLIIDKRIGRFLFLFVAHRQNLFVWGVPCWSRFSVHDFHLLSRWMPTVISKGFHPTVRSWFAPNRYDNVYNHWRHRMVQTEDGTEEKDLLAEWSSSVLLWSFF